MSAVQERGYTPLSEQPTQAVKDGDVQALTRLKQKQTVDGELPHTSESPLPKKSIVFRAPLKKEQEQVASPLRAWVDYFDTSWQKEQLPFDWYNLSKRIGFSMKSQMHLLERQDQKSMQKWAEQTKRDLLGFSLEYLSQGVVFPYQYELQPKADGTIDLIDKKYHKDMVEMTSEDERNGSVKQALTDIKKFLTRRETPEGEDLDLDKERKIAVMPSPAGPSGLKTDNGASIDYPDAYWFIMEKRGKEVYGVTIKTDFTHFESRQVIEQLTGKVLSPTAPLEEYVQALAQIKPHEGGRIQSMQDVVAILQGIRSNDYLHAPFAFHNIRWEEVYRDLKRGEELYEFDDKTKQLIKEFTDFVQTEDLTKLEIQKGLAATFLRISKLFLYDNVGDKKKGKDTRNLVVPQGSTTPGTRSDGPTFGGILTQVAALPGCAGGGAITSVNGVGGERAAVIQESDSKGSLRFKCDRCHSWNTRGYGMLNMNCHSCGTKVSCE